MRIDLKSLVVLWNKPQRNCCGVFLNSFAEKATDSVTPTIILVAQNDEKTS
jgi:hypothetical protein